MTRIAKISIVSCAFVLAIPILLIAGCQIQNWRVQRGIRNAFDLSSQAITPEHIHSALQRRFVIGTPRADITQFLTVRCGAHDLSIQDDVGHNKTVVSCFIDTRRGYPYQEYMILTFAFDRSGDTLQSITVEKREDAF
jgi:hypothetical protein